MDSNKRQYPLTIIEKNIDHLISIAKNITKEYFHQFFNLVCDYTETFCVNDDDKRKYYIEEFHKCKTEILNYNIRGFHYSGTIEIHFKDHHVYLDEDSFKGFSVLLNIPNDILIDDLLIDQKTGIKYHNKKIDEIFQSIRFDHAINILCKSVEFYYYKNLIQHSEKKKFKTAKKNTKDDYSKKEKKYKPKYLMPNGEKYKLAQIAYFAYYKNIKMHDPRYDYSNRLMDLALDFGFTSDSSAWQIYSKTYRHIIRSNQEKNDDMMLETIHLLTKISYKTIKIYIEGIVDLLDSNEKIKAKDHIKSLDLIIN